MLEDIIRVGIYNILAEKYGLIGMGYMFGLAAVILICALAPYFLGSLNFAVILSRRMYGTDIRTLGSGNAGMTNMFRTFGRRAGLLTLAGDVGKAVLSAVLGYFLYGYIGAYLAGCFCVLGHIFPAYYRFKGGKGVLTAAVMILMLDPVVFAILLLIFAVVLVGTRFVSLASVMTALMFPLVLDSLYTAMYGKGAAGMRIPIAILIAVLIIFMHRANLKRIRSNEEPKITLPWNKKEKSATHEADNAAEPENGGAERNGAEHPAQSPAKNTKKKKKKR